MLKILLEMMQTVAVLAVEEVWQIKLEPVEEVEVIMEEEEETTTPLYGELVAVEGPIIQVQIRITRPVLMKATVRLSSPISVTKFTSCDRKG